MTVRIDLIKSFSRNRHVALLVVLFCLLAAWNAIKDLFPRVEFVQWLGRGRESFSLSEVREAFVDLFYLTYNDPAKYNARNFSWVFESGIGPICNVNIACINTIAFVPVALYILAIFYILQHIGCTPLESAIAAIVVLASFPSASILGWQATIPDRLAAFLFCLSLAYLYRKLERNDLSLQNSALTAVIFFCLSLLSVSSKEAAWILLPITIILPYLFLPLNFRAISKRILITLPAVLFMTFHIIDNYVKTLKDPHLLGGMPADNFRQLSRYLFQFEHSYVFIILIGIAIAALLVQIVSNEQNISQKIFQIRILVVLFIAFVCSWVIPIRTQFASPFYMWLPTGVTIASILILFNFSRFPRTSDRLTYIRRRIQRATVVALYSLVLATSVYQFPANGGYILKIDRNFQESKQELVKYRISHPNYRIGFWAPNSVFIAYQFVSSDPASHFWHFVGGSNIDDKNYPSQLSNSKCGTVATKTAIAVFDDDFKLVEICSK